MLRGWAGPELLDSYEAERRPIAAHNVARSADPDGSTRDAADELHVDLGGRIPHVWVHADEGRVSTLDLLGPGLTLFTGPDSRAWEAQPAGGPPVTVRPPGRDQRTRDRHPRPRRAARAARRHTRATVDATRGRPPPEPRGPIQVPGDGTTVAPVCWKTRTQLRPARLAS